MYFYIFFYPHIFLKNINNLLEQYYQTGPRPRQFDNAKRLWKMGSSKITMTWFKKKIYFKGNDMLENLKTKINICKDKTKEI